MAYARVGLPRRLPGQLYPLAVHARLFGGGYGGRVARILAALV